MTYPNVQLLINNEWRAARNEATIAVHNPATGEAIGSVARAGIADLDDALAAAAKGFDVWRNTPAIKRAEVMRAAARLLRRLLLLVIRGLGGTGGLVGIRLLLVLLGLVRVRVRLVGVGFVAPALVALVLVLLVLVILVGGLIAAGLDIWKTKRQVGQDVALRELVNRFEQLASTTLDAQQRIAADVSELRSRATSIEQILRSVE